MMKPRYGIIRKHTTDACYLRSVEGGRLDWTDSVELALAWISERVARAEAMTLSRRSCYGFAVVAV